MSNNHADYNLQYVAEHNAHFDEEGWNHDSFNFDLDRPMVDQSYTYPDPPQNASAAAAAASSAADFEDEVAHAVRTRSGRLTRRNQSRTQSPSVASGVTKSRSPRPKRKAGRKDKAKAIHLPGPLSEITQDSSIPVRDIDAWVNRSAEDRQEEAAKRDGRIARPMNSFMLYRSAYAERTKEWCKENNHQVVSSAAGESWPMESDELREQFNAWAKIERDNHAAAFPNYKFSPAKPGTKKDADDFGPDPDQGDSDAEYLPSRRVQRQAASSFHSAPFRSDSPVVSETYSSGIEYEDQGDYHYMQTQAPRPLPSSYGHISAPSWQQSHPEAFTRGFALPQQQQRLYVDPYQGVYFPTAPYVAQPQPQPTSFPSQHVQVPRFAYVDSNGVAEWSDFGVDPRLTTTELDAGYSRDLDRDRNGL